MNPVDSTARGSLSGYRRLFRWLALAGTLLAGCSFNPPLQGGFEQVPDTGWIAQGRVAIKTSEDSVVLNFLWKHDSGSDHVRLYGNLGKTYADLRASDNNAVLVADNKTYQDPSAEALLRRVLGWGIPIQEAARWLRGIPVHHRDPSLQVETDAAGKPKLLHVGPWLVHYQRYDRFRERQLPTRLDIKGADAVLKISIHQWQDNE
jgi:outer membrane lipoprotein LolB